MKVKEALKVISNGEENAGRYSNFEDMSNEIDKGLELLKSWQKQKQLGEVHFSYYNETGKTVGLSIGFRDYLTSLNDESMDFTPFDEDDFYEESVDFGVVVITYENEGDTFEDSYWLDVDFYDFEDKYEDISEKVKADIINFFEEED